MECHPPQGAQCLQGATLLLPVVAVGNVGQLAVDLIVNTLRLDREAVLDDPAMLPAVGHRGYAHVEGLATAMELYRQQPGGGSGAVAAVQQRAPAAPGTQDAFAERLAAFVQQAGVKEVLVLGSIEAALRRDAQLAGPQLRWWAPEGDAASASLAQRCAAALPGGVSPLEPSFFEDRPLAARLLPPWPLLRRLAARGVPCAALLCFSTEGAENLGEAALMASAAAAAAGLQQPAAVQHVDSQQQQPPQWVPPQAWQYVYGAAPAVY